MVVTFSVRTVTNSVPAQGPQKPNNAQCILCKNHTNPLLAQAAGEEYKPPLPSFGQRFVH